MYKLKCEHCGHLNEVSTEYLTLCSNCNRKLINSFAEWKKKNQIKSFDDYKNEVCIDEELELGKKQLEQRKSKKRHNRLIIILTIAGLVLGSVFTLYHFNKDKWLNSLVSLTNSTDEILDKEWEKKAYYDLHFYLETPYKPELIQLPFPEQLKAMISTSASYAFEKDAGAFSFVLIYIEFLPGIPLNLDNSVKRSIAGMENQPGVTDLTSADVPYDVVGREATIVVGTLKKYGIKFKYQMLAFIDDKSLNQIIITYHENDEYAREAANRIIKSLKLL
jgi:hypothetical protein